MHNARIWDVQILLVNADASRAARCHPSLMFLGTYTPSGEDLSRSGSPYALDVIPYPHLENFIRALQSSLIRGQSVKLFLSTRGASAAFWKPGFVNAAMPFLRRKFRSEEAHMALTSTTPIQASLSQTIGLLTSGSDALLVDSVQNISEEYAAALNKHVEDLEEDAAKRTAFVKAHGANFWREERLVASWTAGLLNADLLQVWSIVVRK